MTYAAAVCVVYNAAAHSQKFFRCAEYCKEVAALHSFTNQLLCDYTNLCSTPTAVNLQHVVLVHSSRSACCTAASACRLISF